MNTTIPIASFKDGIISALRPYNPSFVFSSPSNNHFVQHNLDLSGGTSGSPIINQNGNVIAVNNSGTERLLIDSQSGEPTRVATGNIGFGIRVDEIYDWMEMVAKASTSSVILCSDLKSLGKRRK